MTQERKGTATGIAGSYDRILVMCRVIVVADICGLSFRSAWQNKNEQGWDAVKVIPAFRVRVAT